MIRRPNLALDRQISGMPTETAFRRRCVVSNQRPRIVLAENGIGSACRHADEKAPVIDRKARDRRRRALCDAHGSDGGR